MYKIRTFNQIATRGLDRFPRDQFEVSSESADPHAILLRSYKLGPGELNKGLRAVARAGAGVNSVPVVSCTERGIDDESPHIRPSHQTTAPAIKANWKTTRCSPDPLGRGLEGAPWKAST